MNTTYGSAHAPPAFNGLFTSRARIHTLSARSIDIAVGHYSSSLLDHVQLVVNSRTDLIKLAHHSSHEQPQPNTELTIAF